MIAEQSVISRQIQIVSEDVAKVAMWVLAADKSG
jgi:hypothetical protein